jgi:hypothetical protein
MGFCAVETLSLEKFGLMIAEGLMLRQRITYPNRKTFCAQCSGKWSALVQGSVCIPLFNNANGTSREDSGNNPQMQLLPI